MSIDPIGYVPQWDFADRLRKVRRMQQPARTQAQFAELIGADPKAYSQWEAGNNMPRDLALVVSRIVDATGVSAVWLLTGQVSAGSPPDHPGIPLTTRFTGFAPVVDISTRSRAPVRHHAPRVPLRHTG